VTIDPQILTFDASTWSEGQQIRIAAVNDWVDEGDHSVVISHTAESADALYAGLDAMLAVVIVDDDVASYRRLHQSGAGAGRKDGCIGHVQYPWGQCK
jgi:hypothetical protein